MYIFNSPRWLPIFFLEIPLNICLILYKRLTMNEETINNPLEVKEETEKKEMTPRERSLANLQMFKKGEVSNPNGRPKGSKNKSTIARKWLELHEKAVNEITGIEEVLSQEDLMTLAMIKRAKKGDVKAYKELMNSAFGEDKNINHTGNIGLAHITGMEVL